MDFVCFFEKMCRDVFSFIEEEYGLEFKGIDTLGTTCWFSANFQNQVLSLRASIDFRDNRIEVYLHRLSNDTRGLLPDNNPPLMIDDLLPTEEKNITLVHEIPKNSVLKKSLPFIYAQYAEVLKKYGSDILKGNFELYDRCIDKIGHEIIELHKHWHFSVDVDFENYFKGLCIKEFSFLMKEYGFRFVRELNKNEIIFCFFQNETTGVEISCAVTAMMIPPSINVTIWRLHQGAKDKKLQFFEQIEYAAENKIFLSEFVGEQETIRSEPCWDKEMDKYEYLEELLRSRAELLKRKGGGLLRGNFSPVIWFKKYCRSLFRGFRSSL